MGEFELIQTWFAPLARQVPSDQLLLGPGDDCAIQRVPPGHDLVFSVDTLVDGVHFPKDYDPRHLGWRALAVAASDLAAMGARPVCFTLALTLPSADPVWLSGFAEGLSQASKSFGLTLAGGDTTRGPLTIALQVHGTVPNNASLRRNGAQAGEWICVSGCLGEAGAALDYLGADQPTEDQAEVLAKYHRPQPRLNLGQQLRGAASAAIDVSDGLLADLGHILKASGVGALVDADKLPISPALVRLVGEAEAKRLALTAGDDYQLCVTIAQEHYHSLPETVQSQLTVIGTTSSEPGLRVCGAELAGLPVGFDHFGRTV
ncbi:MAG: thiamine-phosphate kinase [Pseudomonadota bacterium]|nr:thiamine-phosphate kinase [Pseudomonadota bacterium]